MLVRLLDPGLWSTRGHHFDQDRRLVASLERRGHRVVVHGALEPHGSLRPAVDRTGMAFEPTFRVHPYNALPADRPPGDAYRELEATTLADLDRVGGADLWIWPSVSPYQLAAAAGVKVSVRQFAGTWWLPRIAHPQGAASWANAARRIVDERRPVAVGAYDPVIADGCRSFSGALPVPAVPCPHEGATREREPTALARIGFFGHQRPPRGLDVLSPLVTALLDDGFEVVVQDSGGSVAARSPHPRLQLLPFVADFAAEIARCDLVVWPSRWEPYATQLSGVVSECVATGVPVILPSGCLPAMVAARFGCGVFFHDHTVDAILAAVHESARDYAAIAARARDAARAWQAVNGTDRLVDWIERHVGAGS